MESANPKLDEIRTKLNDSLKISTLDIVDDSANCGEKFTVLIVSDDFEGLALVDRHRKIYEILEEEMQSIHSLSLKTYTQAEYLKKTAAKKP